MPTAPQHTSSNTPLTTLRRQLRQQRRQLPRYRQHLHSRKLCQRLRHSQTFKAAKRIGVYLASDGEIALQALWQKQSHKQFYLPIINASGDMHFARFHRASQLRKGQWGLLEPSPSKRLCPARLDLIIAPLVGFDKKGHRIGRGGGFYDRFMAGRRSRNGRRGFIGVAHALQEVDTLPAQPWDIPLDAICTERCMQIFARR